MSQQHSILIMATALLAFTLLAAISLDQAQGAKLDQQQQPRPQQASNGTFFDKLRAPEVAKSNASSPGFGMPATTSNLTNAIDDNDDDDDDDDDELLDDGEEDDEEDEEGEGGDDDPTPASNSTGLVKREPATGANRTVFNLFGNQLRIENNRTVLILENKARDLGLLTLKAIILGPLIGLTIKAALLRGLLWSVGAYLLHLFFPTLLSSFGLGTGLLGFAR